MENAINYRVTALSVPRPCYFPCRPGNEREITLIIKLILVRSRIRPVEITGRGRRRVFREIVPGITG